MNHLVVFIFWPHVSPAFLFQYLNIKLTDISVTDPEKYPHMVGFVHLYETSQMSVLNQKITQTSKHTNQPKIQPQTVAIIHSEHVAAHFTVCPWVLLLNT